MAEQIPFNPEDPRWKEYLDIGNELYDNYKYNSNTDRYETGVSFNENDPSKQNKFKQIIDGLTFGPERRWIGHHLRSGAVNANALLSDPNQYDQTNPFVRLGKGINERTRGMGELMSYPVDTMKEIGTGLKDVVIPNALNYGSNLIQHPIDTLKGTGQNIVDYYTDPYNDPVIPLDIGLGAAGIVEAPSAIAGLTNKVKGLIPKKSVPIDPRLTSEIIEVPEIKFPTEGSMGGDTLKGINPTPKPSMGGDAMKGGIPTLKNGKSLPKQEEPILRDMADMKQITQQIDPIVNAPELKTFEQIAEESPTMRILHGSPVDYTQPDNFHFKKGGVGDAVWGTGHYGKPLTDSRALEVTQDYGSLLSDVGYEFKVIGGIPEQYQGIIRNGRDLQYHLNMTKRNINDVKELIEDTKIAAKSGDLTAQEDLLLYQQNLEFLENNLKDLESIDIPYKEKVPYYQIQTREGANYNKLLDHQKTFKDQPTDVKNAVYRLALQGNPITKEFMLSDTMTGQNFLRNLEHKFGEKAGLEILDSQGIKGTTSVGNRDGRIVTHFNGDDLSVIDRYEHGGYDLYDLNWMPRPQQ